MNKFSYGLLLIISAILLQSCSGDKKPNNDQAKKDEPKKPEKLEEASPVEVVALKRGDIGSYILLNTTIETEQMIDVFAQASGFVTKINKEEGEWADKGDVLVSLDARELEIRFKKAQLDYEQKLKEYNRLTNSANKDVLSKEEVERIEYDYKTALYNRDEVKLNLDYASIKAPVSGIVTQRQVKLGDRIDVGKKVYNIVNTSERIAIVQVPEREVGVVKVGQPVEVFSESLKDKNGSPRRFKGSVKRVSPIIDPTSGTYKVTIALENNPVLRPGMFVNAHIQTDIHKDVVLVPKSTLVYENERKFVFAVRDSVVKKIDVLPGYEDSFLVETLNDRLKAEDRVVMLGQEGLKDNTRVRIVNKKPDSTNVAATEK